MVILHIEHSVTNFEQWKASFENYAALRRENEVRQYRIARLIKNPSVVQVDLEFDEVGKAEALLAAVQQVWQRVGGTLIHDPRWWISEVVETQELAQRTS